MPKDKTRKHTQAPLFTPYVPAVPAVPCKFNNKEEITINDTTTTLILDPISLSPIEGAPFHASDGWCYDKEVLTAYFMHAITVPGPNRKRIGDAGKPLKFPGSQNLVTLKDMDAIGIDYPKEIGGTYATAAADDDNALDHDDNWDRVQYPDFNPFDPENDRNWSPIIWDRFRVLTKIGVNASHIYRIAVNIYMYNDVVKINDKIFKCAQGFIRDRYGITMDNDAISTMYPSIKTIAAKAINSYSQTYNGWDPNRPDMVRNACTEVGEAIPHRTWSEWVRGRGRRGTNKKRRSHKTHKKGHKSVRRSVHRSVRRSA